MTKSITWKLFIGDVAYDGEYDADARTEDVISSLCKKFMMMHGHPTNAMSERSISGILVNQYTGVCYNIRAKGTITMNPEYSVQDILYADRLTGYPAVNDTQKGVENDQKRSC